MNIIIFILGPTSSGKSKVAIQLAEKLGGEIVSADSMQVYNDMDVLTQAPTEELTARVPHHLVKMLSPEEEFSASRFAEAAASSVEEILFRGKVPVFVGGTGLYIKSLVDGLFPSPPRNDEIRERLEQIAAEKGTEHLHRKLREIDPDAAEKIHENDLRRVVRALEIFEATGSTMTRKKDETKGIGDNYDCRMFGLKLDRDVLYKKIEDKVDKMFEDGLVEEVKSLRERDLSITADKALGIKEVAAFLDGEMTLDEAKVELKKNTRRYAKRQLTWFRGEDRIYWVDADRTADEIVEEIASKLSEG
ncbi:MAG: tRNA (adenosine(37)-N6)-dimethylallyltransferase MiaA [Candidatus Tantalella remota]|nr:tRNA (adenosine(37)-N6)-dimethylallyltransferase MiaA [Candidatus Tantalella remota]